MGSKASKGQYQRQKSPHATSDTPLAPSIPQPDPFAPQITDVGNTAQPSMPQPQHHGESTVVSEIRAVEDPLQILARFDTVMVVDDSGSMKGRYWTQARLALAALVDKASVYDTDGIEVHFINSNVTALNLTDCKVVHNMFTSVKPQGWTPLGRKVKKLLEAYLARFQKDESIKPVNFVIITDGVPTDYPQDMLETVIASAAKRLDDINAPVSQVGIQFVQIGNDSSATRFLEALDDNLKKKYSVRDIVDTTLPENGQMLDMIKILTGGVNRRVDNLGSDVLK